MTTTPKDTLKGNKPKPFTGDRSTLDDFVTDCQLYLSISAPKAEGASKKAWILTFIQGGEAAGWKNQYISSPDYTNDTYDQFLARFILAFKDPQDKVNARIALSRLWQNNLPIDVYHSKFILLITKAGIANDPEKAHLFISHPNPDLHSKLAGFLDPSATFQKQFELARNVSSSMAIFTANRGRAKNHYPTKKDDNAMDVDKQKTRGQKIPPLTPELRKKLMAEGGCFRCRQKGHMSRECPQYSRGFQPKDKKTRVETIEESEPDEDVAPAPPRTRKTRKVSTKGKEKQVESEADDEETLSQPQAKITRMFSNRTPAYRSMLAESLCDESSF